MRWWSGVNREWEDNYKVCVRDGEGIRRHGRLTVRWKDKVRK